MDLGIVWRLQDLMSSPMANISRNANAAQRAVDNASTQISQGMQRAIDTANSLQEAVQIEVPPVVIDATQAQRELRRVLAIQEQMRRMAGVSNVVRVSAQDKDLNALSARLEALKKYSAMLRIGADDMELAVTMRKIQALQAMINRLSNAQVNVNVQSQEIDKVVRQIARIQGYTATLNVDDSRVQAANRTLETLYSRIASVPEINTQVNTQGVVEASNRVSFLSNMMTRLFGNRNEIQIDINNASSRIEAIRAQIASLENYRSTLTIGVDDARIEIANRSIQELQSQLGSTQEVLANTQRQFERSGGVFGRMRGWLTDLSGVFRRTGFSVNDLQEKIRKLQEYRNTLRIGVDTQEIARATSEINQLQQQLDGVEARFNRRRNLSVGVGSGIWSMVKGALPALGVAGAVAAGGNILNKGMDREVQVSNFQQFIPDTKLANQTFSNLNQWGNDTIYKNSDVLKVGAKVAEQFGAARVMPQMKMYGDLAGGNAEDLAGIARTMGQIKGVGRLQGDELNELANHGILGLQEEIAKLKGVSLSAFYQMKEKGLISFQDVQKAMERMTGEGGKYFGRLDRMSQTTFGRVQKLWGTIEEKLAGLGTMSLPSMNKIIDWANKFVENWQPIGVAITGLTRAFNPLWDAIHQVIVVLGLVPASGDGVIETINGIASVINTLASGVHFASTVVQNLVNGIRSLPFGDTILQVVALSGAMKLLGVGTGLGQISEALKFMKGQIGDVFSWFGKIAAIPWGNAITGISGLRSVWVALNAAFVATPIGAIIVGIVAVAAALTYAWENSAKFREVVIRSWVAIQMMFEKLQPFLVGTWEAIKGIGLGVWEVVLFVANVFKGVWLSVVWVKDGILKVWNSLSEGTRSVFKTIGEIIITTLRVAIGIATLGLSEFIIWALGKLSTVSKTVSNAYNSKNATAQVNAVELQRQRDEYFGKDRTLTENTRNARRAARYARLGQDNPFSKVPNLPTPPSTGGESSGKTDSVDAAKSKTVVININKMLETVNINAQSENVGRSIQDEVMDALNRILLSGDRLALE
ncbi:tape measure protein [Flectobacillus roseus]